MMFLLASSSWTGTAALWLPPPYPQQSATIAAKVRRPSMGPRCCRAAPDFSCSSMVCTKSWRARNVKLAAACGSNQFQPWKKCRVANWEDKWNMTERQWKYQWDQWARFGILLTRSTLQRSSNWAHWWPYDGQVTLQIYWMFWWSSFKAVFGPRTISKLQTWYRTWALSVSTFTEAGRLL